MRISILIPAFNEEASIGKVVRELPLTEATEVIVADNGSTDSTAQVAREAGARVVHETRRGYGSACLAAMGAMSDPEVVVFLDGDYSDYPQDLPELLAPIQSGNADLVIGSRVLGRSEKGALTPQQVFGNWLATRLIRLLYGARFTDLGPFRAITRSALDRLKMEDLDYGWTVEMQIKAAKLGLVCVEVPVRYRRRIGVSKISGTLGGVFWAGVKILWTLARLALVPQKPEREPTGLMKPSSDG